jgi:hypothetical protein
LPLLVDANIVFAPLLCAFLLGTIRVRPGVAAAAFLLAPLLFALATLIYQAAHPVISYQSAEGLATVNLMGYALNSSALGMAGLSALIAWSGAWAGNRLINSAFRKRA